MLNLKSSLFFCIFEIVKAINYILLYTFFLLTTAPATVMAAKYFSPCVMKCSAGQDAKCEKNPLACCPPGMCNNGQCCYAGFVCPLDQTQIEIKIFESSITKNTLSDQYQLSDFISESWQPPELV